MDVVKEDPTDNRIIECAAASGSEYLVTGDKHLLKVGQYQSVKIVTPAEFIEIQAQGAGVKRGSRTSASWRTSGDEDRLIVTTHNTAKASCTFRGHWVRRIVRKRF